MKLVAGHWGDTPHRVWRPRAAARRKRSDRRAGPGPAAGPLTMSDPCHPALGRTAGGLVDAQAHYPRALRRRGGDHAGHTRLSGAGSPATAASRSISPPGYNPSWAGYSVGGGRWFRFISTTVTVPPVIGGSGVVIGLSHGLPAGEPFAELEVEPGPGGTVSAHV